MPLIALIILCGGRKLTCSMACSWMEGFWGGLRKVRSPAKEVTMRRNTFVVEWLERKGVQSEAINYILLYIFDITINNFNRMIGQEYKVRTWARFGGHRGWRNLGKRGALVSECDLVSCTSSCYESFYYPYFWHLPASILFFPKQMNNYASIILNDIL